jgi:L-cystine transport system permease protein
MDRLYLNASPGIVMVLFDFGLVFRNAAGVLSKLPVTLAVAMGSFALGLILALAVAMIKIYKVRYLQKPVNFYISFMRGTPLLVQLYLVTYGIPRTFHYFKVEHGWFGNFNPSLINPLYFALLAFTLYVGAYMTEDIRASIEAVGVGQFEAARSVGMTFFQSSVRIIVPQTLKIAMPVMGNALIGIVKGTSFLYLVGVRDITSMARILGMREGSPFELHVFVGLMYWIFCFVIERLCGYFEKRLKKTDKNIGETGV